MYSILWVIKLHMLVVSLCKHTFAHMACGNAPFTCSGRHRPAIAQETWKHMQSEIFQACIEKRTRMNALGTRYNGAQRQSSPNRCCCWSHHLYTPSHSTALQHQREAEKARCALEADRAYRWRACKNKRRQITICSHPHRQHNNF